MEGGSIVSDGRITGIRFGLATRQEICKASNSGCPISHVSQLSNPYLGLPLQAGKCESCGTSEPGQCEGHFGYVEFPTPIFHPDHISELKQMLSLLCLKCLKVKTSEVKNIGLLNRRKPSCCEELSAISVNEVKTTDGACKLELKMPSKSAPQNGLWTFLEKYGFRYGFGMSRPLLPSEVMVMLKKIPPETRKKLEAKGFLPQEGYILQYLPVPPNCLSIPDVSDGLTITSKDHSIALLKKVLKQIEVIKNSRSGMPNFESNEIEANELQAAVVQYFEFRGTGKATRDVDTRFGVKKEENKSSTKAWLAKMKTLFIRKGSGFSSRSVITGDPFKEVSEIGLPYEIAQKITFEERVSQHNKEYLQRLVDEKRCLTFGDGSSTYSLREGSKDHTFLRPGQVVHRRIMDGDIVFINRPPTTHKHSLQALSVYVHEDHTVKINPLICGPLGADFDGDCIHLFYPQSLEAKAEVVELFSVERQLLSSHTGNFNLQLATDALLSLKVIFGNYYLSRARTQQLLMFVSCPFPDPVILKSKSGPLWTASQIFQSTLPSSLDCSGEKHTISKSEFVGVDFSMESMSNIVNDIVTSIFFFKGPKDVLRFFNSLQPLLMENLFAEGFSVSLREFFIEKVVLENILADIQTISPLLYHLRASYSESVALQLENYLQRLKTPITKFILNSSATSHLIDCKSESSLSKVVQQIGFLGMQISDRGKLYSEKLVNDMSSLFKKKYPSCDDYPVEEYGMVGSPLFLGLDPFQEMVHSISNREVTVRSSRGLTEPGTLFKNLMAILRDVVICHDNTVRNKCSNSIIQFEYGVKSANVSSEFCPGDPVGVLAATAISNPAYKAVLDSSSNSNSSWEMMKEILLCSASFKNDVSDRRVILFLNECDCGRRHCRENAAIAVRNHLKKVSLKEVTIEFLIEYRGSQITEKSLPINSGLVGHIHLNKAQLRQSDISIDDILEKCQETIGVHQKKKKLGSLFKRIDLTCSEFCTFCSSSKGKLSNVPCIQFYCRGVSDDVLERAAHSLSDMVCPVLLQTIIKGDPKVSTADIIWNSPGTATWIRSQRKSTKGEMALDVILEKEAVKKSGDAWRVVMDSCLPVIHLIDTERTIPYAIKQVQELLGISCAFEQGVQRLSSSVTMVTKGVLKDHLLLLGNSMTCTGSFIGFNAGGIKFMSKSLNVQVPFTDATLFTPRKCFERAAEKCHVDTLSSVVASCAWGKQVSVGTGSPFEILWDTKKADLKNTKEFDVYDFLQLVIDNSKLEDIGTDCLGADIDGLNLDDEYMGLNLTPVHESAQDNPSFADGVEFDGDDYDPLPKLGETETQGGWSSWGKKVDFEGETESQDGWSKKGEKESGGQWGKKVDSDKSDWTKEANQAEEAQTGGAWGKKEDSDGELWGRKVCVSNWDRPGSVDPCDQPHDVKTSNATNWGSQITDPKQSSTKGTSEGWVKADSQSPNQVELNGSSTAWDSLKVDSSIEKDVQSQWGGEKKSSGWNSSESGRESEISDSWSSWKKQISKSDDNKRQPEQINLDCLTSSIVEGSQAVKVQEENLWDAKAVDQEMSKSSTTWAKSNDWSKINSPSHTGEGEPSTTNSWSSSQNQSENNSRSQGWSSRGNVTRPQRGRGGRSRGQGSFNAGDWKNRPRPVRPVDDANASGVFTVTRQRLDLFTVEEQDVLSEIEPIMKNVRRVMHQIGYNDGDPLAAEDQKFIVDNVFNYHPDKTVKSGAGIDFFMVNRHVEFQESRCFYVVSVDGAKQDFSYRKCLENYIRGKYPDIAETFISKYFRRPQPRSGWNRDRGSPRGEAGTPGWSQDESATPRNEAGTPKWTPRRDAETPSWTRDADESGTPNWTSSETPSSTRDADSVPDEST